jgi:acetoacetate decarboxylase
MQHHGRPYTIPDRCPLFPPLPYHYRGYRRLSAYCRADPARIRAALPAGLEAAGDVIEVFVVAFPDAGPLGSYEEGGIIVPVHCGGTQGGHVLYMYVTSDEGLCVGREVLGYPKKLAEVRLEERGSTMRGEVVRRGTRLIRIEFAAEEIALEKPPLWPRILVKRIPRADGEGYDVDQVVLSPGRDATITESRHGWARVALGGSTADPASELGVGEVLGAEFLVGDFVLDHGRVLEERVLKP